MKQVNNPGNVPKMTKGTWGTLLFLFATMYFAFKFNPIDYFIEAGAAGYYQARIGYERGTQSDKIQIVNVVSDGKLTMREYSNTVFPIFGKTLSGTQSPFPESEQKKGLETLKAELLSSIQPLQQ